MVNIGQLMVHERLASCEQEVDIDFCLLIVGQWSNHDEWLVDIG